MFMSRKIMLGALGLAVIGCSEPSSDGRDSCEYQRDIPAESLHMVDVLLVVDDSPAMAPFAAASGELALGAAELIERPCNPIGIHLGVVSGDPSQGGLMSGSPPFLTSFDRPDGSSARNFAPSPRDAVSERVATGSAGSDEQQLLAMASQALDGRNPGFRRPDATLVVIFLAASDDRSPESVESYADRLRGFADPDDVLVAATNTPRLDQLVASFAPVRGWSGSLEQQDGVLALFEPLLDCLTPARQPPCLEAVDPNDYECVVLERGPEGERVLPACNSAPTGRPNAGESRHPLIASIGASKRLYSSIEPSTPLREPP